MDEDQSGRHLRIRMERAIDELRRGRGVLIEDAGAGDLVFGLEAVDRGALPSLSSPAEEALLVISRERARALGYHVDGPASASFDPRDAEAFQAAQWLALAAPPAEARRAPLLALRPAPSRLGASLELLKKARLLPAAIALPVDPRDFEDTTRRFGEPPWSILAAGDIGRYPRRVASDLCIVARVPVPLRREERCEFVLFREGAGAAEHVAILVGAEPCEEPVLLRMHSACLTGDLFDSLRCDCGSQLHASLDAMVEAGGGVLLYLPQEGRGIGLANKLRAYALQDQGFDTVDADALLGFLPDERNYEAAAQMLAQLGIGEVLLLTYNPHYIDALRAAGVRVRARVPLAIRANRHNVDYLRAKASRAGHWLDEG